MWPSLMFYHYLERICVGCLWGEALEKNWWLEGFVLIKEQEMLPSYLQSLFWFLSWAPAPSLHRGLLFSR